MTLRSLRLRWENWPATRNCVRSWVGEAGTGFINTHRKLARRGLPKQCYRGKQSCMTDRVSKIAVFLIVMSCCAAGAYLAVFRPSYANNSEYLGGLIFLQIVIAALWSYRQRFFPALQIVFLWAATFSPFVSAATVGRWFVLAAGVLVGFLAYMKDRSHRFGAFHLLACCCVVAAFISAMVSSHPALAALKAFSILLLLFSFARAAIVGALLSCILLCIVLRQYRLLVKGLAVSLAAAALIAAVAPPESSDGDSLADVFVYKGKRQAGLLGSRQTPWQQTVAVIQERPWFGSGFGTSKTA